MRVDMISMSHKTDNKFYLDIFIDFDIKKLGSVILPSLLEIPDKYGDVWTINFCPLQENNIYIHLQNITLGHLKRDKKEINLTSGHNMFKMYWALRSVIESLNLYVKVINE